MSLAIDPGEVTAVLLVDGWHEVEPGSFYLDSYEFAEPGDNGHILHGGGDSGICAVGFACTTVLSPLGGEIEIPLSFASTISGPLTSILAVRTDRGAQP